MRVRDAMTRDPVCCTGDTPIHAVSAMMREHDIGSLPVVEDLLTRFPVGVITDRDIVTRTIAAGHDPMTMLARDCMTSPAITIVEGARLHECVQLLEVAQIRRVIVVDDAGACVGILAQADIARSASRRETGSLVRHVSRRTVPAFVS
ncbi:MAG TPA: CBS domain-containing protein [Kofleriaceae bacterium]|nr:CBS domain-containing protein [Kofleriaceae bacterium]